MISVCFRFDDPSALTDHELERRIFELFTRFEIPLCVAVVPFARSRGGEPVALSRQNAGHLLEAEQAGSIEIAQHGHTHAHRGNDARGVRSEFAGIALDEQARLIGEGLAHLTTVFGSAPKGFVPPWNTYDRSTALAVDLAGFEYLSAGWDIVRVGAMPVIPRTCTLKNAQDAIGRALAYAMLAPLLVVVFHPDDFEEFAHPPLPGEPPPFTNLRALESLLRWIRSAPSIRPAAIRDIATSVRNGTRLRDPGQLRLPDRVKARIPAMLARTSTLRMYASALRGSFGRGADPRGRN